MLEMMYIAKLLALNIKFQNYLVDY